ncbi:MAG: ATP-binding protein [Bacteroidota bacterium]
MSQFLKSIQLGILIRLTIMCAGLTAAVLLWINAGYHIVFYLCVATVTGLFLNLLSYLNATNRQMLGFLEAIKYNDFSQTFSTRTKNIALNEFHHTFNEIIEKFKQQRLQTEENERYLQTVVQHIGIGLISFSRSGKVVLLNTAAKRLLNLYVLRDVHQLENKRPLVFDTLQKLGAGERALIRVNIDNVHRQIAMYATEFRQQGEVHKLISFQNISNELDEKEMEAWHNLTQVLAHEIMNSITPIASLSDTVHGMIEEQFTPEGFAEIDQESVEDVKQALTTIRTRSMGLMRFVNSYKNISQIPEPQFTIVEVSSLLEGIINLMSGETLNRDIMVDLSVEPASLEVTGDRQLLEQAVINIFKNAVQAVQKTEHPHIQLLGRVSENGTVIIEIIDNGPGINPAVLNKIFVPFYTTGKQNEQTGTGIGLSLSRQIMRLHHGSLLVNESKPGRTVFTLRF